MVLVGKPAAMLGGDGIDGKFDDVFLVQGQRPDQFLEIGGIETIIEDDAAHAGYLTGIDWVVPVSEFGAEAYLPYLVNLALVDMLGIENVAATQMAQDVPDLRLGETDVALSVPLDEQIALGLSLRGDDRLALGQPEGEITLRFRIGAGHALPVNYGRNVTQRVGVAN